MASKNLNICHTKMNESSNSTFIWIIDNFPDHLHKEYLESGVFNSSSPSGDLVQWRVRIYSKAPRDYDDWIGILIYRVDSNATEVSARVKFWIRNSNGVDVVPNQIYIKTPPHFEKIWQNYFVRRSALSHVEMGLIPGNQLTIVFEVTIFEEATMEMKSGYVSEFEVSECSCRGMEDFGNLFKLGVFTDCTLVADDGTKFQAHKNILACRSPFFGAMFEHEMIEAKEGIAKIKDIKSPVLEQMLWFIYSGKAPNLGEMAVELFKAADIYGLDRLKMLCGQHLANSIGIENVCGLLVLAEKYSDEKLLTYASNYIQKHTKEVMETDGWKMMIGGNHVGLIEQIAKAYDNGQNAEDE